MNGWINSPCSETFYWIDTFGDDSTGYLVNDGIPGSGLTLGMNVTFLLDGNGKVIPSSVVWDGTYSKTGIRTDKGTLFDGVPI